MISVSSVYSWFQHPVFALDTGVSCAAQGVRLPPLPGIVYPPNYLIELIQGMQRSNCRTKYANDGGCGRTYTRLFGINLQSLAIDQYQNAGTSFISQLKDILITFLTAKLVIDGEITLGMMLVLYSSSSVTSTFPSGK